MANNTTTVGDNNDNVGRRERERVGVIVYAVDTKGWFGATLAVSHERGADVKEADTAVTPPALGAPTQFCVIQGNAADRARIMPPLLLVAPDCQKTQRPVSPGSNPSHQIAFELKIDSLPGSRVRRPAIYAIRSLLSFFSHWLSA